MTDDAERGAMLAIIGQVLREEGLIPEEVVPEEAVPEPSLVDGLYAIATALGALTAEVKALREDLAAKQDS